MTSPTFVRLTTAVVLLLFAGFAGMVAGHDATPPVAYAIDCQPVNDVCTNDNTKTSAMHVTHDKSDAGGNRRIRRGG